MNEEECFCCDECELLRYPLETEEGNNLYVKVMPGLKMLCVGCDGCGSRGYVKARYCPMCGRKL